MALLALPLNLQAQEQKQDTTLTRTVVVEQEYNPDIMDAAKVNVLPHIERPAITKKAVEYNETSIPASQIPPASMQSYTIPEKQGKDKAGYARLGYGMYNNLDVHANYLFTLSDRDKLNLTFNMDGRNGDLDMGEGTEDWKSRYYRTQARVDYLHNFRTLDLNVAGNFGLHNFNLQPGMVAGKQKFTSGDIHLGVKSTDKNLPVQYKAETNLMFYGRQNGFSYDRSVPLKDMRETLIRTKADVWGGISEKSGIGLGLGMDNFFYDGLAYGTNNNSQNYTELELAPHYLFHHNGWDIRLGMRMNVLLGIRNGDLLLDRLLPAPDVKIQYTFADSYQIYAQATADRQTNDFRRLEQINPYANLPYVTSSTYEWVNAALGFKASPTDGLWLHVYGGLQSLINDMYAAENYNASSNHRSGWPVGFYHDDIFNGYAGLDLTYSYRDIVTFSGKGIFHHWEDQASQAHLYLKPAFELYLNLDVRPTEALTVSVGHEFVSREGESSWKAESVNNLYASAAYKLFDGVSVYVQADNLLNKHYLVYYGCPAQSIRFLGGVSFRF